MSETPDLNLVVDNPRYSVDAMAEAITETPNEYGALNRMGLFPEKGVTTTYIEIERKKGVLNLLPASQRGGQPSRARPSSRDKILLPLLYYSHEDSLRAAELQNLPAFGTRDFFESFDELLGEKFGDAMRKFRQTYEYLKWGALRGKVYDADGVTELYDCYDLMGEEQRSIDFKLGSEDEDQVMAASREAGRHMEDALLGEMMTGIVAFCSRGFMDKLLTNKKIWEIYVRQQHTPNMPNPLVDDMRRGFKHGDIYYVEHSGKASYVHPETGAETVHQFIADGEAILVPLGTEQVFRSFFGPGTTMETVNQKGMPVFPQMKPMKWNTGIEMWFESAPMFLVEKPRLVMRGYSSN